MSERRGQREHTLIIDRLVDEATAVVEIDGSSLAPIPRLLLPVDADSDAVLRVARGPRDVSITIDSDATEAARRESARLMNRLRTRDPGGDIAL